MRPKTPINLKSQFTRIYKLGLWESGETISGVGSTLENTVCVRKIVLNVLNDYKIRSVLDAPCGDFNWFSNLLEDQRGIDYHGFDIVKEIINKNKLTFGSDTVKFGYFNLAGQLRKLPKANLIICRDLLVHLSLKKL